MVSNPAWAVTYIISNRTFKAIFIISQDESCSTRLNWFHFIVSNFLKVGRIYEDFEVFLDDVDVVPCRRLYWNQARLRPFDCFLCSWSASPSCFSHDILWDLHQLDCLAWIQFESYHFLYFVLSFKSFCIWYVVCLIRAVALSGIIEVTFCVEPHA